MARETLSTTPLQAGGKPIDEAVAAEAAEWFTAFMAGEMSDTRLARWRAWRAASPDHERAWSHIEAVARRLRGMDPAAKQALRDPALHAGRRRRTLQALLVIGATGALAYPGTRTGVWQRTLADHWTHTGEQREIALADGTRLLLNTDTAVEIRFDADSRQIVLLRGEIRVISGHGSIGGRPDTRPLLVRSAEGRVMAMGTRFTVRQQAGSTEVSVQESRVRLSPRDGARSRVLDAGQRASFTPDSISATEQAGIGTDAWTRAQIVADDMRLADFLAELSRYRVGFIRCDPAVADLRFSAVLPLRDTDRILAILSNSLPVRVSTRSRYWVTVEAAR